MLTFEEFFKKKKIHLPLLQAAEPALFAEFEQHYNQMGEKSFDHTKKYWFNPLRRKYHTPPEEPKIEKVVIENQLAEQTITESLSEQPAAAAPKLGFKPKFSAATKSATPVENVLEVKPESEVTPDAPTPKLGFKPKFKSAAPTPTESAPVPVEGKSELAPDVSTPKLGFKPKFKSATASPTPVEDKSAAVEEQPVQTQEVTPTETTAAPKLGFKPKFKAGVTKTAETTSITPEEAPRTEEITEQQPEAKPAYKPKFQAKNFKPKTDDE